MPYPVATPISISNRQRNILNRLVRRRKCPRSMLWRARIILAASEGMSNSDIARQLSITRGIAADWRGRWSHATTRLETAEEKNESDKILLKLIEEILSDHPRPGCPATFSAEQLAGIIEIA